MKWIKRLGISLTIAFFAVCCGAVLLFNWHAFGYKALSVPTGSMRPGIPSGSLVLMHRVPYQTLKVGDVITYTNPLTPTATVTHRVVKVYKINGKIPAFIAKGDANKVADAPVVGGQVLGKAVWHAPYIGQALIWSKTWTGIAMLVYLPAALIMWGAALDMADYMRRFQLYELKLFRKTRHHFAPGRRTGAATLLSALFILILGTVAGPVQALMHSNTVVLGPNRISVAGNVTPPPPPPPPPATCSTLGNSTTVNITNNGTSSTSHNSTTINNSNNQTSTTGNVTNSGNTNGGNATSGNATNTNCTVITVTNTNH